jgi:hypothetical protein
MKANINIIAAMMLFVILASCGNKDNRMLTVINEDGTCSREYTFHSSQQWLSASSSEDYDSIVDKTWERSWSVLGADSVRYPVPLTEAQLDSMQELDLSKPLGNLLMVHAKKEYQCVEEMSAHLYRAERHHLKEVDNIKANSTLEKHFKWFYTDYTFSETFVYDGPALFPIPLDRFLSADTASFWFTGQPDLTCHCSGAEQKDMLDDIEKKIGQWTNANWFYEICNVIIANYDQIQNPPVSKERFSIVRDSLVMMPCVLNANEGEGLGDNITNLLEKTFQSDAYKQFLQTNESGFRQYEQLLSFGNNYDLQMPGTVIDAGMGQYDGDVIHYRLGGERLIPGAYTITATSRVTNVWAFVITILVVLLAIGSLFFRKNMKCFGK